MTDQTRAQIDHAIKSHKVVLFMKGTRSFPQCGFSATVVSILNQLVPKYETLNVLTDPALREGIKEYSQWPTIPQLYIAGEFIGGCDIVKALHASGELAAKLDAAGATAAAAAPAAAPAITLTPAAARAIGEAAAQAAGQVLRMEANARFQYELYFGDAAPGDLVAHSEGVAIHVDADSAGRLDGTRIDFRDGPGGSGFDIQNPHEPPRVQQLQPAALKQMLDAGEPLTLVDVRPDAERRLAAIAAARPLDEAALLALDRATPIVFHCHHGGRSQRAAEHFVAQGFKKVYNLAGGIDAWSMTVDPSVPRY
jgi:monothiol glutaredoxin